MIGDYGFLVDKKTLLALERAEHEIVNYIFFKLFSTIGKAAFARDYGEGESAVIFKKEWQPDLIDALHTKWRGNEPLENYISRCKIRIDKVFKQIRQDKTTKFLNMQGVCAAIANYQNGEVEPTMQRSRKTNQEKNAAIGEQVLTQIQARLKGKQYGGPNKRFNTD